MVECQGIVAMDVELSFLHEGLPKKTLTTKPVTVNNPDPALPCPARLDELCRCDALPQKYLFHGICDDPV